MNNNYDPTAMASANRLAFWGQVLITTGTALLSISSILALIAEGQAEYLRPPSSNHHHPFDSVWDTYGATTHSKKNFY